MVEKIKTTAPGAAEVAGFTHEAIDSAPLLATAAGAGDGAVATFIGVVRDNQNGRAVRYLGYEAHETMALAHMERLVVEAQRRWAIGRALIRHRLGEVQIGDVSVVVVVAASHRAEAMDACRWLIDTLKGEVPIFKKEHFADGEASWVGEGELK